MEIALIALILFLSIVHHKERRELYNRIMSKDLDDFAKTENKPPPPGRNMVMAGIKRSKQALQGGEKEWHHN